MIHRLNSFTLTTVAVVRTVALCAAAFGLIAGSADAQSTSDSLSLSSHTTISQPAQVQPYEQTEMLAKASGFVSRVNVDIGDRVTKGQILVELWIPEMEQEGLVAAAKVDEAAAAVLQMEAAVVANASLVDAAKAKLRETQASVAQYQSNVDLRQSEHERITRLVGQQALNDALLDEKLSQLKSAEAAFAAAEAAVASAEANVQVESARLKQAGANLRFALARQKLAEANRQKTEVLMDYAKVRAPFDGLVTHRGVDTGDFVASAASNATMPLLTVCSVDRLRIVVDIPESQAPRIRLGQRATLVVDALKGKTFPGSVKRTAGVLDPRTRTLRVEAELDSPTDELRPGMFGSLTVELAPASTGG